MNKENNKNYSLKVLETVSTGILHDMASPITTLSLSTERIKKREKRGYCIDSDIRAIEEATNTMKELLFTTRQMFNTAEEKNTIFDIGKEIQTICTICKPRTDAHSIKLILSKKMQQSYVRGQRIRFQQVILNLISNSIEAFGSRLEDTKKCIVITIHSKKKEVGIKIKDNGTGISLGMSKRIFKPFNSTKRTLEEPGTGIGLSHIRQIVEQEFGGKISLISHHMPTCFYITLPRQAVTAKI